MFSRLLYAVPTTEQLKSLTTVKVPVTTAPSEPVPVAVTVKAPLPVLSPYLPSIAPRIQPVVYPTMPAPVAPAPVVAPEPEPLAPHKFSTCATCGEEKVEEIQPVAAATAPKVLPAAPAPSAPAPAPAPETPTAAPKRNGWLVAVGIVLLLTGALALASAVRPRK